jgi:hypothetical protein
MIDNITYIQYLDNAINTQPVVPEFHTNAACSGTCPLVISSISVTNVTCVGGTNGTLTANLSSAINLYAIIPNGFQITDFL